ncbi:hypothetical protein JST97_09450 [bacterium]|nr:hypothetical protein [bacterium]
MRCLLCLLLLALPLVCEARGRHCHVGRSHFIRTTSFYRPRTSFFGRLFYSAPLQPLQYNGQSATDLLEMDGAYTRDSLVKGLALALAPKGNRMLPCVLDFDEVIRQGGFERFLADWEPPARQELLGYLQQIECEDTLRITNEVLARTNPTQEELAQATQELLDDGNNLYDALWDYCYDHREAVAGL